MGLERGYFADEGQHIVGMYKIFEVYAHLAMLEVNTV
jgi:hypothetical protein